MGPKFFKAFKPDGDALLRRISRHIDDATLELIANQDPATVGVLQTLIGKEDNSYVRLRCRNALREMNASVGTF